MPVSDNGNGNKILHAPVAPIGSEDREFWLSMRQAFLMMIDNIETRILRLNPTTAEIRRWYREAVKEAAGSTALPKS